MTKIVKITLNLAVDEDITPDEVAQELGKLLESKQDKVTSIGGISVDTVLRGDENPEFMASREADWSNTVWSKATC